MNKQAFDELCRHAADKQSVVTPAMTAGGAALGGLVGGERGAAVGGATGFGAAQGTYLPMIAAVLGKNTRGELLSETSTGRTAAAEILRGIINRKLPSGAAVKSTASVMPTAAKVVLRNPRLRALTYLGGLLGAGAGGVSSYFATKGAVDKRSSFVDDMQLIALKRELMADNTYRRLGSAGAEKAVQTARPIKILNDVLPAVVSEQPLSHLASQAPVGRRGFMTAMAAFAAADDKSRRSILRVITPRTSPARFIATSPDTAMVMGAASAIQRPGALRRHGLKGLLLGGGVTLANYAVDKLRSKE